MNRTVTLEDNRLLRRQYEPKNFKVAKFDTPVVVTKGEQVFRGPSTVSLAALDRMLAKDPSLRIQRAGPGEYIFWHRPAKAPHA